MAACRSLGGGLSWRPVVAAGGWRRDGRTAGRPGGRNLIQTGQLKIRRGGGQPPGTFVCRPLVAALCPSRAIASSNATRTRVSASGGSSWIEAPPGTLDGSGLTSTDSMASTTTSRAPIDASNARRAARPRLGAARQRAHSEGRRLVTARSSHTVRPPGPRYGRDVETSVLSTLIRSLQQRLAAAVVIGMLTFGAPMPRPVTLTMPPAVVRVQVCSPGAEAWRAFFPDRPLPN